MSSVSENLRFILDTLFLKSSVCLFIASTNDEKIFLKLESLRVLPIKAEF